MSPFSISQSGDLTVGDNALWSDIPTALSLKIVFFSLHNLAMSWESKCFL